MKTKIYTYISLLILTFAGINLQAQDIMGYSDLFTFNTAGAELAANFSANTVTPAKGETVQFNDISSGTLLPNSWVWDFGDGSPVSNILNPVHVYHSSGSFDVKLTVTNAAGVQSTIEKLGFITVNTEADGILLKIVSTDPGSETQIVKAGYSYAIKKKKWGFWSLEDVMVDTFQIENGMVRINKFPQQSELPQEQVLLMAFNNKILLFDQNGQQRGHIFFEFDPVLDKENIRNAILIFHNDSEMAANFPYGEGMLEYDSKWNYYKDGEYPVTMLIPPENIFPATFNKQPLLFVHGWGGTYSYKQDPDALPSANEVSYWFTTVKKVNELGDFQAWQYYYPYDTDIITLGKCLKSAIGNLKLKYPPASTIGIITHSMGGLVTSEYITSNPADAKNKVFKVLYSVPPVHGSIGANKHYKTTLGNIVEFSDGKRDRSAPAPRDMALGSEFMWNLHSKSWVNLNGENNSIVMDDYFVLLGTTTNFFPVSEWLHSESSNHNDGIVSISSGSLTDKQIGFATFHGNHDDGVHMQSEKRNDPENQNIGNPMLIPQIVNAYFTENHTDFLNTIKSFPDIQTVVDGNRIIEKPANQTWETINSNPEVDFKKGILNFRISESIPFEDGWPGKFNAFYNPSTKRIVVKELAQSIPGYVIIGSFYKNKNVKSYPSYFFSGGRELFTECALNFNQDTSYLAIMDYFNRTIVSNYKFNLNYCETQMITIDQGKYKEIDHYPDQTDLKNDIAVVTNQNPPNIFNTGFWVNVEDTAVNFICRIVSDSFINGIQMKLKTPEGLVVDSSYMDGLYSFNPDLFEYSMIISDPQPGKWFVFLETESVVIDTIQYESIAYLQSDVHAYVANKNKSVARGGNYRLKAGLQMVNPGLTDSLNVEATVFKPSGFLEVIDAFSNPIQTDSSLIFQYDYPVDSAGYYIIKFNYEGVYNGSRFERSLWQQFKAIDTIPFLNIPDIVLRQQEFQKTLELNQYAYNVDKYDTLYFSSEILSSNLDSLKFSSTLDSLALSSYFTTNLADTGTVIMRFNCHFDDNVISDTVEINVLLPELVFEGFQISDSITSNTSNLEINYSIMNKGNYHTASYDVKYYISQDSLIQPGDYCLGLKTILNHNADTTLSILDTINIPGLDLAGSFYLLVKADASDQINEVDETNNLVIERIYLNLPPSAPTIVSAIPDDGIVDLTWKSNSQSGILGYIIYYGLDSTAVLNKTYNLTSDTTYTVSGLVNDTAYYFAVSAYKTMGIESQLSTFVPATPTTLKNQLIHLAQGWSGISSYIVPGTDNVEALFGNIVNDLIILQNTSGIYWPGENVNTLGVWNTHEGYQIKVANDVEFTISGTRENDKTLQLAEGWNLIPALSECEVDIAEFFNGAGLTMVKEVAGWNVYWPEFGINTLGVLEPGKAYFVLMAGEASVTFPECTIAKGTTLKAIQQMMPEGFDLKRTASSHTIVIPKSVFEGIQNSRVLIANDASGNCFGVASWNGENTSITLFGDDPLTDQKDGFFEGEEISFELQNEGISTALQVEFDQSQPQYDGLFHTNGLSAIKAIEISSSGYVNITEGSFDVYPNPADEILYIIKGFESNVELSIISIQGIKVFATEFEGLKTEIDIKSLPCGVYFVRLKGNLVSGVKRVVIK